MAIISNSISSAIASAAVTSPIMVFKRSLARNGGFGFDLSPGVAAAFWRECVIDGNIVAQWLANVGRKDARGRLAHLLCEMAVRSNQIGRYVGGRFPLPVTQEQIADALGLTSVHVNRTMQSLRGEGLVHTSNREVIVLDWQGLIRAGEFDASYLHLPPTSAVSRQASAG